MLIYIPLWSDSIPPGQKKWLKPRTFTFHYGRIQSLSRTLRNTWTNTFTFHYGRIQSRFPTKPFFELFFIYIPLWSDSIVKLPLRCSMPMRIYIPLWSDSILEAARASFDRLIFTFHYGRIQSSRSSRLISSYFHLHSIMVGFNQRLPGAVEPAVPEFTFHYGRIQSIRRIRSRGRRSKFTFHYGRIQSQNRRITESMRWNLHSIMVGFNRCCLPPLWPPDLIYIPLWSDSITTAMCSTENYTQIYIPLWSDSIQFDIDGVLVPVIFTFHYGRIQSLGKEVIGTIETNLHSIMVGFNRETRRRSRTCLFHLHSIMVGFNLPYPQISFLRIPIYIPLWSDSIPS